MKNELVAKVITDKNGVKTTRWVKPDKAGGASTAAIPNVSTVAPTVSSVDRKRMVNDILEKFTMGFVEGEFDKDIFSSVIPKFENATLSAIVRYLGDDPDENKHSAALWLTMYNADEPYFRELLTYHDAFDPSTDYSFVEESIYYLKGSGDLPPMTDYSAATPELQQTIRNLLSATETYVAEDYEYNREGNDPILPPEVRKIIMERPEDIDRINDILLDNPDTDPERIKMMLDSDNPSIAKGLL